MQTEEEIEWFADKFENASSESIDDASKKRLAKDLLRSQAFDHFLANKFVSVKRYGGEGAESMMAFFSEFFNLSAKSNLMQ